MRLGHSRSLNDCSNSDSRILRGFSINLSPLAFDSEESRDRRWFCRVPSSFRMASDGIGQGNVSMPTTQGSESVNMISA